MLATGGVPIVSRAVAPPLGVLNALPPPKLLWRRMPDGGFSGVTGLVVVGGWVGALPVKVGAGGGLDEWGVDE